MSDWVSVNDRLPEPLERVLVYYTAKGVKEGYVFSDGSWILEDIYGSATHWMPMPDNPGDEELIAEDSRETVLCEGLKALRDVIAAVSIGLSVLIEIASQEEGTEDGNI